MKKIFLTAAIILGLAFGASAQGSDGFFSNWSNGDDPRTGSDLPEIPNGGLTGDQDTPLGGGLLILIALGAGYAALKKRD